MFHVGQKVVCVNNQNKLRPELSKILSLNAVYTVESIINYGEELGERLLLCEVSDARDFDVRGYRSWRFRPVVEQKTDTGFAILQDILKGAPVKELA